MSRGERTSQVEPRGVPEEHSQSHENIIGSCQVQLSAEASHTEEYAETEKRGVRVVRRVFSFHFQTLHKHQITAICAPKSQNHGAAE